MSNKKLAPLTLGLAALMAACTGCGTDSRKVITFWTGFGTNVKSVLEPMLEDYPDKDNVLITHESKGGYDNLYQAIAMSVTTKSYPNIALAYPDHMANYLHSNILAPLNGYLAQKDTYGVDKEDFISAYMVENESFGKISGGEFDGQNYVYGLPFNKSTEVMVYNKTFFDLCADKFASEGITVPATWDEVETVGAKIINLATTQGWFGKYIGADGVGYASNEAAATATGKNAVLDFSLVSKDIFHPISYDSQSNFFITAVRQWGGTYTSIHDDGLGYYEFDSQETRDALNFFQKLAGYNTTTGKKDASIPAIMGVPASWEESSYCSNPFKVCKSLMNIGSSGGVYNAVPSGSNAFEVACAPIPYKTAEKKYVISQGTNLVMTNKGTAEDRADAFKVIAYLTSTEFQTEFALQSGYYPATESALNSDDYQAYLNAKDGAANVKVNRSAAVVNARTYLDDSAAWNKFVDPGFEGSTTIRDKIAYILPLLMAGEGDTVENVLSSTFAQLVDYAPAK